MSRLDPETSDWLVICDFSGRKCWASETVKTWQGYRVLKRFVGEETQRHPQDLPPQLPRGEGQVPWARPEATDTFIDAGSVTADDL